MMKSSSKNFLFASPLHPFPSHLRSLLQHYLCFKHKHFFKAKAKNSFVNIRKDSEGAIFILFEVPSVLKVSVIKLSVHQVGLLRPQIEM